VKLEWPRRGRGDFHSRPEPATLIVRVESAFALELQHMAPLLIERINAHYGWRCVGRLVLKQGPVPRAKAKAAPPPELTADERTALAAKTAAVSEAPLRDALERLGGRGEQAPGPPHEAVTAGRLATFGPKSYRKRDPTFRNPLRSCS
jgi:hypothetical protein